MQQASTNVVAGIQITVVFFDCAEGCQFVLFRVSLEFSGYSDLGVEICLRHKKQNRINVCSPVVITYS